MSENYREVYRAHIEGLRQYVYFILAAAAAAIAFAVNQTRDARLESGHAPLGLAVLSWGVSFYFGCRHIQSVNSGLYANAALLQVQSGTHPDARGREQQELAAVVLREIVEKNSSRASRTANLSFWLFITGAICFVLWHIWQMYTRSFTPVNVTTDILL